MEFARTISESADVYLIGALLPVLAALLARRCYFQWADRKIFCNIFSLLVGHPGDRKSSAIHLADRQFARQLLSRNRFIPETISSEALFDEYCEGSGGSPDKILIAHDANPLFAGWRKTSYGEVVARKFLTLYDCSPLAESFRRNTDQSEDSNPRRYVDETSTSMLLGATFNIAQFQGQEAIRMGLQRRFLYYVAQDHGRLIALPRKLDPKKLDEIVDEFRLISTLQGQFEFSTDAEQFWVKFQTENRTEIKIAGQDGSQLDVVGRLNEQPMHALKIAMIFQATLGSLVIERGILEAAIEHVRVCALAAGQLDQIGERARITSDADILHARIHQDFAERTAISKSKGVPTEIHGSISLSKSELTAKYCHHSNRPGALTPHILYQRLIPNLVERGLARKVNPINGTRKTFMFLRPPPDPH
jgi:hypothetical protein